MRWTLEGDLNMEAIVRPKPFSDIAAPEPISHITPKIAPEGNIFPEDRALRRFFDEPDGVIEVDLTRDPLPAQDRQPDIPPVRTHVRERQPREPLRHSPRIIRTRSRNAVPAGR